MSLATILAVDDDPDVISVLRRGLTLDGYRVLMALTAEAGLALARRERPDAIILDVMLPGLSGVEACRLLRQLGSTLILMLTARDTLQNKITGLDAGADDYLVKPFALTELSARLRALLRRARPDEQEVLVYGDLQLNRATHGAMRGGRPIELRAREFALLEFFLAASAASAQPRAHRQAGLGLRLSG